MGGLGGLLPAPPCVDAGLTLARAACATPGHPLNSPERVVAAYPTNERGDPELIKPIKSGINQTLLTLDMHHLAPCTAILKYFTVDFPHVHIAEF